MSGREIVDVGWKKKKERLEKWGWRFLTHYSIPLLFLNSLPLSKYNNKTQHIYINSNLLISTHITRVQSFYSIKDYFNLYCKSYNRARSPIRTNWPWKLLFFISSANFTYCLEEFQYKQLRFECLELSS